MNYSISYAVSTADYSKFARFACHRVSKSGQSTISSVKTVLFNFIAWFVIAVVLTSIFQSIQGKSLDLDWLSVGIGALPFVLILIVTRYNLAKIQKLSMPKEHGAVLGTKKLTISEQGVMEEGPLAHMFFSWPCLEELIDHEDDLYLFFENVGAIIITGNAFHSDDEKMQFTRIVNDQLTGEINR